MPTLYDGYGNPYSPKKRPERAEVGVASIRDRWSSYPSSGLNPEKLAAILKEADQGDVYRQAELFEEMEEKDTHLFSVLQTRKIAVCGCELEVSPASDSLEDQNIAEFITEQIADCQIHEVLFGLMDAVGKGYAASEIMWRLGDQVTVREIKWRHAKRFTFYDSKTLLEYPRLLTDAKPAEGEDLAPNKWIFHRYRSRSGATSRGGILRTCAWMYLFKNYAIKDWVVFAEVYGMPLRLGRYDEGASKEDRQALITAVQSLGTDAAGVISKSTEIEFIESVKNARGDIYQLLTDFCNKEMSKAVLGQVATTEGSPGKLGNEDAQDQVREDLKEADAKALAKTLQKQLIQPLVGFNFGWEKSLPKIKLLFEKAEDLKATADTYKTLVEAGFDGIPKKHIHEKFGIPTAQKGEETLSLSGSKPESELKEESLQTAAKVLPLVLAREKKQQTDRLDPFVDQIMGKANLDPMIDPIAKLMNEAGSLKDFKELLLNQYKQIDPVRLGDLIQQALATAELLGRFEATEK